MRIVLFGASGFIGEAVCRAAVTAGREVIGVIRSEQGADRVRAAGAIPLLGALAQVESWRAAVMQADAVIQLAADFAGDPAAAEAPWVAAMLALHAEGRAPQRILYTGGCWLFPARLTPPIDDATDYDPLPAFAYMVAHRSRLLAAGLSVVTIHPGIVWSETGGFVAEHEAALRAAEPVRVVGSVETRWPLVHVEDLADLYLRALMGVPAGVEYFGVTDASVGVAQMIRRAERITSATATTEVVPVAQAVAEHGGWIAGQARSQAIVSHAASDSLGWRPERRFDP
jgi:nucleoside-diphosphate-sugar epimerase